MTYQSNNLILAADYNNFKSLMNGIYGAGNTLNGQPDTSYGYGNANMSALINSAALNMSAGDKATLNSAGYASSLLNTVNIGQLVKASEWLALRQMMALCAIHQGTTITLPITAALQVPQPILAYYADTGNTVHNGADIPGAITALRNNRMNIALGNYVTNTNALSSQRTSTWQNVVGHGFHVTFADANSLRYFFNTGGQIGFSAAITGLPVGYNTSSHYWSNALHRMGTVWIGGNAVFPQGRSTSVGGGVYNGGLGTSAHSSTGLYSYSTLYDYDNNAQSAYFSTYGQVIITIGATFVTNGAAGTNEIGFLIFFQNNRLNSGGTAQALVPIQGSIATTIQTRRSTAIFTGPTPTLTTTIAIADTLPGFHTLYPGFGT